MNMNNGEGFFFYFFFSFDLPEIRDDSQKFLEETEKNDALNECYYGFLFSFINLADIRSYVNVQRV